MRITKQAVAVFAALISLVCTAGAIAQDGNEAELTPQDPVLSPKRVSMLVGDETEFGLGIDYAHITLDGAGEPVDEEDAIRIEARVSTPPFEGLPELRLGGAFGCSYVDKDASSGTIIINNGQIIIIQNDCGSHLTLLEPEVQLSWRQEIGNKFFIEPGVACGWVFGNYHLDLDETTDGADSIDVWSNTWSARAFVRIGFEATGGIAGFEAGYMKGGNLDFTDSLQGDVSEWYVGIWGAIRL